MILLQSGGCHKFPTKKKKIFNISHLKLCVVCSKRLGLMDLCFSGLGWFIVTPTTERVKDDWHSEFVVHSVDRVNLSIRDCLLPYEASNLRPIQWNDA